MLDALKDASQPLKEHFKKIKLPLGYHIAEH